MKIAVTYDDGNIFQNFESTNYFKIYTVENKEIISTELAATMGKIGHNDLVGMLSMIEIDALICGNINNRSAELLDDEGITLYSGCQGNSDKAVNELIFGDMFFENNF